MISFSARRSGSMMSVIHWDICVPSHSLSLWRSLDFLMISLEKTFTYLYGHMARVTLRSVMGRRQVAPRDLCHLKEAPGQNPLSKWYKKKKKVGAWDRYPSAKCMEATIQIHILPDLCKLSLIVVFPACCPSISLFPNSQTHIGHNSDLLASLGVYSHHPRAPGQDWYFLPHFVCLSPQSGICESSSSGQAGSAWAFFFPELWSTAGAAFTLNFPPRDKTVALIFGDSWGLSSQCGKVGLECFLRCTLTC